MGRPQAVAGRERPGAATSAPPGSLGSQAPSVAEPRGRAPCPAAPLAPMPRREGPPTSRAPRAKPAWPCRRAARTQAARVQQPGAPAGRLSIESPQRWRSSPASIAVFKPQHASLIQVARSRQGRTPSRRFCDTVGAGLPSAPGGSGRRVPLGTLGFRRATGSRCWFFSTHSRELRSAGRGGQELAGLGDGAANVVGESRSRLGPRPETLRGRWPVERSPPWCVRRSGGARGRLKY